jgi:hypothetical protein
VELRGGGLEPAVGKGEVGKDAPIEPITEPLLRSPNPQDFAAELDITFRPPSGSSEGLRSDESFKQISPRDLPGGSTHGDIEACPSIDRAMSPESMQLLDEALRETTHSQAAPEREQTDGTLSAGAQPAEASLHISSLGESQSTASAPSTRVDLPGLKTAAGRSVTVDVAGRPAWWVRKQPCPAECFATRRGSGWMFPAEKFSGEACQSSPPASVPPTVLSCDYTFLRKSRLPPFPPVQPS